MPEGRPIVVAVDGSPEAQKALTLAARLSQVLGHTLVAVTVVPPPQVYPAGAGAVPAMVDPNEVEQAYKALLVSAEKDARAAGASDVTTMILRGPVVDTLLRCFTELSPLMAVLGARGLSATARLFLGSVSDAVVHHAHCPVLVVRGQVDLPG